MNQSGGTQSTEGTLTPERFEEVRQELAQARQEALATAEQQLAAALERIAFARGEREETAALRARLGFLELVGDALEMHTRLGLLVTVYARMEAANQVLADIHQQNVAFFSAIPELSMAQPVTVSGAYQVAHEDLRYIEARAGLDVAMLAYHWFRQRYGLDLLLRIHFNERALSEADGIHEARQAENARSLQQAMTQDKDLMVLIGKLASDAQEAQALLEWGKASVKDFEALPAEVKRQRLADRDWALLNGKLTMLLGLSERVAQVSALAVHFPIDGSASVAHPVAE